MLALAASVARLYLLPLIKSNQLSSLRFTPGSKKLFWFLVAVFFLLTWIGARPVEEPYVLTGQVLTLLYFGRLLSLVPLSRLETVTLNL